MALNLRPWPLAAGGAIAAAGAVLVAFAPHVTPWHAGIVVAAAALLELGVGLILERRAGPGMAHVFAGVLALSLVLFIWGTSLFDPMVASAPPIAGMLGMFCFVNGLFRALDCAIDRPADLLAECIDAAVTFAIGVALLFTWRSATPAVVAVAAGIESLVGGAALVASGVAWSHAVPAYDGRPARLIRLGEQVHGETWENEEPPNAGMPPGL